MKKSRYKALFAGILLFSALFFVVTHYGDLARFAVLISHLDIRWIVFSSLLQLATYISLAMIWHRTLSYSGIRFPLDKLIPLALAKLFADQALPSGGISGIAFIISAFRRRNVSDSVGMGIMLLSVLSFYVAYAIVACAAFFVLWIYHDIHQWTVVLAGIFFVFIFVVPGGMLLLKQLGREDRLPAWLIRLPFISGILETFDDVSGESDDALRNPMLMVEAVFYQIAIFALDSATLWSMLKALGEPVSGLVAFPCFVIASIVALLSFIPLGIGSFEATCVGLLVTMGISLETALMATLLLRGFTLWLPMIPGVLLTRRELR
ncbi:MAG TPA: lysylphosphatidylglycerol synthase transmembrane domain-containing protein [Chlorobaculum sp.]|nr:lysylphosphatidylglycerol synthase transmembrane domain-containing protein [Chlorobaculum sp.]